MNKIIIENKSKFPLYYAIEKVAHVVRISEIISTDLKSGGTYFYDSVVQCKVNRCTTKFLVVDK